MTPDDIDAWLDQECRKALRAQRAAEVFLAVVIAILGAAMLVHFLTPCAEGVLC